MDEAATRADAKARGLKRYFTGKPCKHGHVTFRLTSNGVCNECAASRLDAWRSENAERIKGWKRDYYAANATSVREYAKKWRTENLDRANASMAAWRERSKAHEAEYRRQYQEMNAALLREKAAQYRISNPGKRAALQMKRQARKMRATPPWLTPQHFSQIDAFYNEARRLTEETGVLQHVDHIVPLRGRLVCGLHVPWNLQVLPANDNLRKSNKHAA